MFRKTALVTLFLLFAFHNSLAQYGSAYNYYRTLVTDVRAKSMGNTEITGSTGSSSIFSNPANMSRINQFQIMVNGGLYTGWEYNQQLERLHASQNEEYNPEYDWTNRFNGASISYPFEFDGFLQNFTIGFGFRNANQASQNYTLNVKSENEEAPGTFSETFVKFELKGGIRYFTPGVSLKFSNGLSVGFTHHSGKDSEIESIQEYSHNSVIILNREIKGKIKTEYQTIGISYGSGNLGIGLTFDTEHKVYYDDLKAKYVYENGDTEESEESAYTEVMPYEIGFGVYYKLLPNIQVINEIETRRLSDLAYNGEQGEFENKFAYRFGIEYIPFNNISLRGGFFSDYYLAYGGYMETDPLGYEGITGGIGMIYRNMSFNIATEYIIHSEKVNNWNTNPISSYLYENKFLYIDVSATLFFDFSK